MGRDPPLVRGRPWSPGMMDRAETFTEAGLSITSDAAQAVSGTLQIAPDGDTISEAYETSGSSWGGDPNLGVVIEPNADLPDGVEVEPWGPEPAGTTRIKAESDGTVLAEQSSVSGGDTVVFNVALSAGTRYVVEHDVSNRDSYTRIGSYPFPAESPDFDVVSGWLGGGTSSYWYSIGRISVRGGGATSASASLKWPMPADLSGWDIVPYEATPDGGTVEVYVEDENGNEILGPLNDPGDISGVARSTNVRLRVDFSRSAASENPRLESIYRRYKV